MAMQKIKKGGFVSDELQKINANFNEVEQQYAKKSEIPTAPTKVSELANDANYQNGTQVAASIQSAIAATGHAKFVQVDTIPTAATAAENVLYLVMNATTGHYDIYAKVSGEVLLIDDTTVNLTGYSSTAQMNAAIAAAVAVLAVPPFWFPTVIICTCYSLLFIKCYVCRTHKKYMLFSN